MDQLGCMMSDSPTAIHTCSLKHNLGIELPWQAFLFNTCPHFTFDLTTPHVFCLHEIPIPQEELLCDYFRVEKPNYTDMTEMTVFELEEILVREKRLFNKRGFIEKLPDKGAKIKTKILQLEEELASLKAGKGNTTAAKQRKQRLEAEKLDWNLNPKPNIASVDFLNGPSECIVPNTEDIDNLDSDDTNSSDGEATAVMDEEVNENDKVETTLRMLATSQVSQHQPKQVVMSERSSTGGKDCPLYIKMMTITTERRSKAQRFIPNRPASSLNIMSLPSDLPGPSFASCASSPALSTNSLKENFKTESDTDCVKKVVKYDECLLTPKTVFGEMKLLSMSESFQLNTQQFERQKKLEEDNKPKKAYAHEALFRDKKFATNNLQMMTLRRRKFDVTTTRDISDLEVSDELTDESEKELVSDDEGPVADNDVGDLEKLTSSLKIME